VDRIAEAVDDSVKPVAQRLGALRLRGRQFVDALGDIGQGRRRDEERGVVRFGLADTGGKGGRTGPNSVRALYK
jgi:hypothetical protein